MLALCGGVFAWSMKARPREVTIVFVLTSLEISTDHGLLRHESVSRLRCRVLREDGEAIATIDVPRPGAVSAPALVTLPSGEYALEVRLELTDGRGGSQTRTFLRRAKLDEDRVQVTL